MRCNTLPSWFAESIRESMLTGTQNDAPDDLTVSIKGVRYVIITPARNEEENIEATIRSVVGQSILPSEWIIVNDGSTDQTGAIIRRYAIEYPWIRLVDLPDRGFR